MELGLLISRTHPHFTVVSRRRSYVFLWSLGGPRTASLLTGSLRRQPLTGSLGLALLIWLKAVSWCLLFTGALALIGCCGSCRDLSVNPLSRLAMAIRRLEQS